jgi:class I fructose-bisphosphate aldolase
MTSLGKAVRINRLKNPKSQRIFTVAMDHAPSYGILSGLQDIQGLLKVVVENEPDAILLMKGVAENCYQPVAGKIPLLMKCSMLSPLHPQHDVVVGSVEDALRLGADAIAMAVTFGSPLQSEILANLSLLVKEAEKVGLPVIVHAYPNGELIPQNERYSVARVGYASRVAMELGVDIIKTFYTGSAETFAEVVQLTSPALVVAAGGQKLDTDLDVLRMVKNVVKAGGTGVTIGRNVWQNKNVAGMMQAIKKVIHDKQAIDVAVKELSN